MTIEEEIAELEQEASPANLLASDERRHALRFKADLLRHGYRAQADPHDSRLVLIMHLQTGQVVEVLSEKELRYTRLAASGLLKQRAIQERVTMQKYNRANKMVEVDVCSSCYGRHTPMRKLQAIYPDWPPSMAPECDYCTARAKYHIVVNDWITFVRTP